MNKHTQGKWGAFRLLDAPTHEDMIKHVTECIESGGDEFFFIDSDGVDGGPVICHVGNGPTSWENAKRIISCVNACDGINPDAVPLLFQAAKDFVEAEGHGQLNMEAAMNVFQKAIDAATPHDES